MYLPPDSFLTGDGVPTGKQRLNAGENCTIEREFSMHEIRRKSAAFYRQKKPMRLDRMRRSILIKPQPSPPTLTGTAPRGPLLQVVGLGRLHRCGSSFAGLHGNDRVLMLPAIDPEKEVAFLDAVLRHRPDGQQRRMLLVAGAEVE